MLLYFESDPYIWCYSFSIEIICILQKYLFWYLIRRRKTIWRLLMTPRKRFQIWSEMKIKVNWCHMETVIWTPSRAWCLHWWSQQKLTTCWTLVSTIQVKGPVCICVYDMFRDQSHCVRHSQICSSREVFAFPFLKCFSFISNCPKVNFAGML